MSKRRKKLVAPQGFDDAIYCPACGFVGTDEDFNALIAGDEKCFCNQCHNEGWKPHIPGLYIKYVEAGDGYYLTQMFYDPPKARAK